MPYAARVVLVSRSGQYPGLDKLVEHFIKDDVRIVAVTGVDCQLIEEFIDELVVGDASDESRFLLTTAHPDEALDDVLRFISDMSTEIAFENRPRPTNNGVQVVYL